MPLNHEFHLQIFGLSPLNLVLDEVRRLWTLADPFIALDYAAHGRRHLTISQHEQIIDPCGTRPCQAPRYHPRTPGKHQRRCPRQHRVRAGSPQAVTVN